MNVLVGCEFSGRVRDAFRQRGHNAWSCDILSTESECKEYHFRGDILYFLEVKQEWEWDLLIAFPPCTYLASSGQHRLYSERGRWAKMEKASKFFLSLLNAPIKRVALENPMMHTYALHIIGEKQSQCIQPYFFGHDEVKTTCFWLKNLPKLEGRNYVMGSRERRVLNEPNSLAQWKNRSRTLPGIAEAMAEQWGGLECQ